MKFARVEMLLLIWGVVILLIAAVYGARRRRRILSRWTSSRCLPVISRQANPRRRNWKTGLTLAALVLVVVAMTGPRYGYRWEDVKQKGVDLIIALDLSRSMLANDIQPTRLDRAKREIMDLLEMLEGDRAGLVAFAGTAFLQCPLTVDYAGFHLFLQAMTPDDLPVGGTNFAEAVAVSIRNLDTPQDTEKAVILITDGGHTAGGDPMEAARTAAQKGVKIFCIGVGNEEGVPIPEPGGGFRKDHTGNIVLTRLDENMLKSISAVTGGTYVRSVAGDMDLDVVYRRDIRGSMERRTIEGARRRVFEDRYQWFLAAAVFLLLSELFIPPVKPSALLLAAGLIACFPAPPAVAETDFQAGVAAYEAGDFEAARSHFINAEREAPENAKILYNIGSAAYRLKDYETAAAYFRKAADRASGDLKQNALFNLGNAKYRKGEYKNAVAAYNNAYTLSEKNGRPDQAARENRDFVKRMMARPKPPPKKPKDGDSNEKNQKTGDAENKKAGKNNRQKQDSETRPETAGEKGEPPPSKKPEDGPQTPRGKEPDAEEPKQSPQFAKEMQGEAANLENEKRPDTSLQSAAAEKSQPESGDPQNRQSRKQLLNRLQDKPGKAMIPAYGDRRVEKDW